MSRRGTLTALLQGPRPIKTEGVCRTQECPPVYKFVQSSKLCLMPYGDAVWGCRVIRGDVRAACDAGP